MAHIESKAQRACVSWFRGIYPEYAMLLFAVPNGGARSKIEASIMKGEGVTAGVSDLILMVPRGDYHALCIEMKKEAVIYDGTREKKQKGYQSNEQKAWQAAVESQGYRYAVSHGLDEFKAIINEYFGEDRESIEYAFANNPFLKD